MGKYFGIKQWKLLYRGNPFSDSIGAGGGGGHKFVTSFSKGGQTLVKKCNKMGDGVNFTSKS